MGLFRGGLAVRRYQVIDPPSTKNRAELRRKLERGVVAHKFSPVDPKGESDRSAGWVSISDLDDNELGDGKAFGGTGQTELRVGLRIDRLVAPPVEVKRQLQIKSRALEEERGRPLGRTEKKNLKTMIERKLRERVFPQTQVYDLVWDLEASTILFWGQSKKVSETLIELFTKSFGLQLEIDGPSRWANRLLDADVLQKLKPADELWKGFADVRPLSLAAFDGTEEQE